MGNVWDDDEWKLTRRKFIAGAGVAGLLGFFAYLSWPAVEAQPASHLRSKSATAAGGTGGLELVVSTQHRLLPAAEEGKEYATGIVLTLDYVKQDSWQRYRPFKAELRNAEGWVLEDTFFSEDYDCATTAFEVPIDCVQLNGAKYRVTGINPDTGATETLLEAVLDYRQTRTPLRAELACDDEALKETEFSLLNEHRVLAPADKVNIRGIAFDWQNTQMQKRGVLTLKTLQHNHRYTDEEIDPKYLKCVTLTFDKTRDFNYLRGTQYWLEAGGAEILRVKLK
jgi:hypothetical protein